MTFSSAAVQRGRTAWRALPRAARQSAFWSAGLLFLWLLLDHHLDALPGVSRLTAAAAPRGIPFGIVLLGVVMGSLNGLTALGMVLVHRAQRAINFAQADVGGVGAVLAIELVVVLGWGYVPAVLCGLAAAALLGGLTEFLVIRRFFRSPRLILTVATIGLQQLFGALELGMPNLFHAPNRFSMFTTPFSGVSLSVAPTVITGDELVAMVAVPLVLLGLVLFFRRSRIGVAVRGSAENAERAALLGIPVKRLGTIVWVIAALLSALAVTLRAPVVGTGIAGLSGSSLLLRALAPAVIGRMESLGVTLFASLGLGVVEQAMVWNFHHADFVDPALLAAVIVALLVQRGGRDRVADLAASSWRAISEVRPVPAELRRLPEVRLAMWGMGAVLLAFLLVVPHVLSAATLSLSSGVLIYAIVACSLVVLTGWTGQLSLGNMALAGLGAAVAGQLYQSFGVDMVRSVIAGTLTGGVLALVVGIPALRIRGLFLGATTLALAVATGTVFLQPQFVPWLAPTGTLQRPVLFQRIDLSVESNFYYVCLAAAALAVGVSLRLRSSQVGRSWIAVRDNERAARALGIDPTRAKMLAFACSGMLAAFGGSLFAFDIQSVPAGFFGGDTSLSLFVMVVIGGLGSIPGAIFGAAYVRIAQIYVTGPLQLLVTGAGLLAVLLWLPGGLGSLLYGARDAFLRRIAARRNLVVPALNMDADLSERLERRVLGEVVPAGAVTAAGSVVS
ncbi:MAG TPA: ABC transporter permease [Candidatus Dormibacteraeota bacterium]|nr:ABC transporter permease [Candidatus Dormibacteraeota bacterium]